MFRISSKGKNSKIGKIEMCLKTLFFDGQIKHVTKVAQKELNRNFILLMSRKHICIMHYALCIMNMITITITITIILYNNHNHNTMHNDNA